MPSCHACSHKPKPVSLSTIDAVGESIFDCHMTVPKHYLLSTMADKESPSPSDPSVSAPPAVDAKGGDEKMAQPTSTHVPIQDETATQATSTTSSTSTVDGPSSSSSSASTAADATPTPSQNPVAMLFDPLAVAITSETSQDAAAEGATSSDDAQQQSQPPQQQDVPQAPKGPTRGGILSPLAGLFGGAAAATTDAPQEEGAAAQQPPSASFDLEAAADATETASDTVCSTTTDGDQQSDDDGGDSAAKATPPSSPSNRSATVLTKASFAATDPCGSFGDGDNDDDDEEWIDNDPSGISGSKKRKKKASDTTAKALPAASCCRRYKRHMLYCLAFLGIAVVFMGAGIVIGRYLLPASSSSGDMEATQAQSKPEAKPADESVVDEDAADAPNSDIEEEMEMQPAEEPADETPLVDESSASTPEIESTAAGDSPTDTDDATSEVNELFNDPAIGAPGSSNETDTDAAAIDEEIESDDGGDPNAYEPGNLQTLKNGVLLSKGLDCKIIAKTGKNVKFTGKSNGAVSDNTFHARPDFGATFPTEDGGWVYVSNSEVDNKKGGVGAIYFNKMAEVIDYKMLLKKTSMNCGGGRTPWDTWISCEEVIKDGQIWEVDPLGVREAKKTVLGGINTGGRFESFTYDVRDKEDPRFYYTEDRPNGPLRRFRPTSPDWSEPYKMLHGTGEIEFLVLNATTSNNSTGTYSWTKDKTLAEATAAEFFPGTEGVDAHEGSLYFVSKKANLMYVLNLDGNTWESRSTVSGVFDGSPDQLTRLVGEQEILYYTEEGGSDAGIHGRDAAGNFFSILESPIYREETTGLAFSPDHKHLYVAYQKNGILLDVWREDGLTFSAKSLNIKYHNTQTGVARE